jgi:hypothetical protein
VDPATFASFLGGWHLGEHHRAHGFVIAVDAVVGESQFHVVVDRLTGAHVVMFDDVEESGPVAAALHEVVIGRGVFLAVVCAFLGIGPEGLEVAVEKQICDVVVVEAFEHSGAAWVRLTLRSLVLLGLF